jgi:cysteine desulfurase
VGALVAHRTIPLQKVLFGGGQERELRPGTENPLYARSFAKALTQAAASSHDFSLRALPMRERLAELLKKEIQNVYINSGAEVAPNILNLSLPSRDTDYLVALLDAADYAVSTRSACETDSEEGSRAVFVLTGDPERAKSTLRISWGRETRERELMRFGKELIKQVAFLDNTALKSHY